MKTVSCAFALAVCAAWGQKAVTPVEPALAEIAGTRWYPQASISPDGLHVAYVESLPGGKSGITVARGPGSVGIRITADAKHASDSKASCDEEAIAWSPDSKQIAFLSDCAKSDQFQLYVAPAAGGAGETDNTPHWIAGRPALVAGWKAHRPSRSPKTCRIGPGRSIPRLPIRAYSNPKIYEQRIATIRPRYRRGASDFAAQYVHLRIRLVARRRQFRRLRGRAEWETTTGGSHKSIRCLRPAAN